MYPLGVSAEQIEAFLAAHPEKRDSILDLRSVVRRADRPKLLRDISQSSRSTRCWRRCTRACRRS